MLHIKYLFLEEGYQNNLKFIIRINFESIAEDTDNQLPELSYDFNLSTQSFFLLECQILNIFLPMIKKLLS